jgi:hypothetical protein
MYASRALSVSILSFAFALAGLIGTAGAASDRLVITDPSGVSIFDNSISEVPATGAESSLTFAGGPAPVPPPIPISSAITIPGIGIVVLSEPPGTAPEPGETPLVLPGPNGDVFVSDLVVSTLVGNTAGVPAFVTLLSDGDPELQTLVPILATIPGIHFLVETGQLQDLTALVTGPVPGPFGPISVFVQSDVVPEPETLLLLGVSLASLGFTRSRRRA